MRHLGRLHRFALAAVGHAPKHPVLVIADGVTGVPEFRRDALVIGMLDHPGLLAVLDFPADFAAELEIQAHLVDAPGFVEIHIDAVLGVSYQVIQLPGARHERDIIVPGHGNAGKSVSPAAAVALVLGVLAGQFPRGLVSAEDAVVD